MVAQYITTRPILDLCKWSTRRPQARVFCWWWELFSIDLEESKKRAAESATESESESESELELDSDSGGDKSRGASGSSGAEWSGAEE